MTSVADGGKGAKILAASAMQMRRATSVEMTVLLCDGKVERVSAMSAELCEDAAVGVVKFAGEKRNDTSG